MPLLSGGQGTQRPGAETGDRGVGGGVSRWGPRGGSKREWLVAGRREEGAGVCGYMCVPASVCPVCTWRWGGTWTRQVQCDSEDAERQRAALDPRSVPRALCREPRPPMRGEGGGGGATSSPPPEGCAQRPRREQAAQARRGPVSPPPARPVQAPHGAARGASPGLFLGPQQLSLCPAAL